MNEDSGPKVRQRTGRGACQVCLCRYRLLKLGGYAVGQHRDRRDPNGAMCAGSNRQPLARSVRWTP